MSWKRGAGCLIACARLGSFHERHLHDDRLIAEANSIVRKDLSNSSTSDRKFSITAEDMCDYPDLRLLLDLLDTHPLAFLDEVNRTRTKGRQSHQSFF